MIRGLKADGTAVLLSSHLLDRVQAVCDRVALFNQGKIALEGTVPELAQRVLGGGYIYEVEAAGGEIRAAARRRAGRAAGDRRAAAAITASSPSATCAPSSRARSSPRGATLLRLDASGAQPRHGLPPLFRGACRMARRSGSALTGLGAVFLKEFADHLGGAGMHDPRMAGAADRRRRGLYRDPGPASRPPAQDPFLFLRLFTQARDPLPSFVPVLGFLIPLVAIGLAFDSINGEFNRRTMSRMLAQPIYRDALLLGKFLAGLATLAVALLALWLLVMGLGLVTWACRLRARRCCAAWPSSSSPSPMAASGWRWRCCSRWCSARPRHRRLRRSASGCS